MNARRTLTAGLCAGLAGLAIGLAAPAGAAPPGPLVSCPGLLECAVIPVPLDHADPAAGSLGLVVSHLRPKKGLPSAGTLLFLTGGPGQAGIARDSAEVMHGLRALSLNREVVSVDLRGTGRSGALNCPALQGAEAEGSGDDVEAAVAECAAQLGPSRRHYDTGQVVEDLETVRRTLGIERWAIGGVSYGTYVAMRYARAYPDRVDHLLLDSLVPTNGVSAVGAESLAASRRIIQDACPPGTCGGGSGTLADGVARLDATLSRRPVPGTVVGPDGTAAGARIGGPAEPGVVYEALLAGDLHDASRAAFPSAVRAALSGDSTLLMRIVGYGQQGGVHPTRQSVATQIASLCEDSALPWRSATPPDERRAALSGAAGAAPLASGPFAPQSVAALSTAALCVGWPEAPEAPPERRPLPAVPTLLLAGGADVRTPQEGAYELQAEAPGSELVVVPHHGHSVLSRGLRCVDAAVRRFFAGLPAGRPCSQQRREMPVLPVPPSSFAAFRAGLRGRAPAGVSLAALRATVADIVPSIMFGRNSAGRGLRGGRVEAEAVALAGFFSVTFTLRDFSYVPGVRVTGIIKQGGAEGRRPLPAEGRVIVTSPVGRADARLGEDGVRLRLAGAPPAIEPASVSVLGAREVMR